MNTYLLFKSLHLISVISWMAGLLYLPRIFVYHAENNFEIKTSQIFKVMEKKLYFYIMTPAMIFSWFFGLLLILNLKKKKYFSFWSKCTQCIFMHSSWVIFFPLQSMIDDEGLSVTVTLVRSSR